MMRLVAAERTSNQSYLDFLESPTPVGSSGRSMVYRGRDRDSGELFSVKRVNVETVRPRAVDQYLDDFADLSALSQHPNITSLLAARRSDRHTLEILQHYCPQAAPTRLATNGPSSVVETMAIGLRLAEGLDAVHQAGRLHLELTTADVLFADEATPCVADIGLGSLYPRRWRLTSERPEVGACHTPPELLDEREPTEATDVYALASILVEILTGTPPIGVVPSDSNGALALRILSERPASPTAPGIPGSLVTLLGESLAKEPAERPATMGAFGQRLWDCTADLDAASVASLTFASGTSPRITESESLWSATD